MVTYEGLFTLLTFLVAFATLLLQIFGKKKRPPLSYQLGGHFYDYMRE